jgi:hypothetical protein
VSKLPVRRLAFIAFGVLALIGALVAVRVQTLTHEQWTRMQARVEELKEENRSRTYGRPVLRGEALPGNAWDDYAAAGIAAAGVKTTYDLLYYVRGHYPKDPFSKATLAAAPLLGALGRLQEGARKSDSHPALGYYHAMNPVFSQDQGTYLLPWVGMVQARALIHEGHPADAVALWLDLFQFGRDQVDATNQRAQTTAVDFLEYLILRFELPSWRGRFRWSPCGHWIGAWRSSTGTGPWGSAR